MKHLLAILTLSGCVGMVADHITPCGLQVMPNNLAPMDYALLDEGERLWVDVFVKSGMVTDPRFKSADTVCEVFGQYQLWLEPEAWFEVPLGVKVSGASSIPPFWI
jgi:hypothetical protein